MEGTLLHQGTFTSDGTAKYLVLRSDVDWIRVINRTQAAATNNGYGFEYYWQRGMEASTGIYWYHPAGDHTVAIDELTAANDFELIDTSDTDPTAAVAITAASNTMTPVILTGDTTGLANGDIVRLSSVTAAETLGGWDFAITNLVPNTSFDMAYAMANAAGAAGTAGFWRKIPYDPIFYPRYRYIVNITAAVNAVITTSVPHGYTVGQKIRVNLPDDNFGMTQIHQVEGIITAVTASTITTDIDSSGFTAFAFALPAVFPVSMPTVVPLGIDSPTALAGAVDLLGDAKYNTAYLGMKLPAGTAAPGGNNTDVIYWLAGKSTYNTIG